jgi:broad specificity phosphatase PhoE
MSCRFVLVRHARVSDSWKGRIYGNLDVPLSPEGEEHSIRVAGLLSRLRWDGIFDSGLARARFLAERVQDGGTRSARDARSKPNGGVVRRSDARLREIGRGDWAGLGRREVEERAGTGTWSAWLRTGGTFEPPGAETFEQLAARVDGALIEHARSFPDGEVLVVAHRWVLTVAVARCIGLPLERGAQLMIPTCGAAVIDWPSGGEVGSETAHLLAFGPAEFVLPPAETE